MLRINTTNMDDFVALCDEGGGWCREAVERFGNAVDRHGKFQLETYAPVDPDLDPFSDAYFQQQIGVYEEISGRAFNQIQGELLDIDVDDYVNMPNPRSTDISFVGHHISTITSALQIANLPAGARILDVGCGTGLSCEMLAYLGARVTALDINPSYVEVINRRAAKFGWPITAYHSDCTLFEDDENTYDAIMFFESLHHVPKPWESLAKLSRHLKGGGKFIIIGEPIEFPSFRDWWSSWGVRLDAESVYVARKFGWFETGFSDDFFRSMFRRFGYNVNTIQTDGRFVGGGRIDIASPLPCPPIDQQIFFNNVDNCKFLGSGWSYPEHFGVWSDGENSEILLRLPDDDAYVLTLHLAPFLGTDLPKQSIVVNVDGQDVDHYDLTGKADIHIGVKASHSAPNLLTKVILRFCSAVKPSDISDSADGRLLGAACSSMAITRRTSG